MQHLMNRPRYESLEEARSSLEARTSHELIDDAFDAVERATRELIDEYELDSEVDADSCVDRVIKSVQEHESDIEMYASSGSRANRSTFLLYAEMMRQRYVRE